MLHYHWHYFFQGASKPSEEETETNGVLTSPNFGDGLTYPNDLNNKQTIQVEEGKAIKIHFTHWDVEHSPGGECDYVTITEGDGTTLADLGLDFGILSLRDIPEFLVSKTDTVHVLFHTDDSVQRAGWRLIWGEFKSVYTSPTN